ncbi:MAG: DUF5131 family protein [Verrucomicrobiota bacterium]
MPLNKSAGNMYPWVTHTHNHMGGVCPHHCSYCYVDNPRFGRPPRYTGPIRLIEEEFRVRYGEGKTIFVENMGDMFAADIPGCFIDRILAHCIQFPGNSYVYQTKNPARTNLYLSNRGNFSIPHGSFFGTTLESNRHYPEFMRDAPHPIERAAAMMRLAALRHDLQIFITVEPVMDFDPDVLGSWLAMIRPSFVNIGADSKSKTLPEPNSWKIHRLIEILAEHSIEVRQKHNLTRILSNILDDTKK